MKGLQDLSFTLCFLPDRYVGKATISNDGATIISLLDVVHPAAKTLVDISKSQDAEVCKKVSFIHSSKNRIQLNRFL